MLPKKRKSDTEVATIERFVQETKQQWRDHFCHFSTRHLLAKQITNETMDHTSKTINNGSRRAVPRPYAATSGHTVSPHASDPPEETGVTRTDATSCSPSSVPLWSQDPQVNAMVFILMQSETFAAGNPSLQALLQTLKKRLKTASTMQNTPSSERVSGKAGGSGIQRESAMSMLETLVRAFTSGQKHADADAHAPIDGHSSAMSVAHAPPVSESSRYSDTEVSKQYSSSSDDVKPSKKELLKALQQHLDILEQRGQVSSVIPGFLKQPRQVETDANAHAQAQPKRKRVQQTCEADVVSTSSTMAVQHRSKRRRQCTSKFQYYEDLATEIYSNMMVPIPEHITIPSAHSQEEEEEQFASWSDDEPTDCTDSTDIESLPSSTASQKYAS